MVLLSAYHDRCQKLTKEKGILMKPLFVNPEGVLQKRSHSSDLLQEKQQK
jgi:hypothetical protein